MTYSDKYKFFFFHVPKTGGTPIYKALQEHCGARKGRMHINVEKGKLLIPGNKWDNYLKFSFVRNPFSRMVSWYFWIKQEAKKKKEIIDPGTFENFIKHHIQVYSDQPIHRQAYQFRENQFDFLGGGVLDFIGKFEQLEDGWKIICDKIGIKCKPLKVYKKQDYGDYRDYYTNELREIVFDRFKKDFEVFGYVF